jgi:hypothetical protein
VHHFSHYLFSYFQEPILKINKIKLPNDDEIPPFPHHQEHIVQGFGGYLILGTLLMVSIN